MNIYNVGVVFDSPFTVPTYSEFHQSIRYDSLSLVSKRGTDFELFHQIFVNLLKLSVKYVEFPDYNGAEQALRRGQVDILSYTESYNLLVEDSVLANSDIRSTPPTAESYPIFINKKRYTMQLISLTTFFKVNVLLLVLLFSVIAYILRVFTSEILGQRSRLFPVEMWFLVITITLGLYSNFCTVNLLAPDKKIDAPYIDLIDLSNKLKQNKCKIIALEDDLYYASFLVPTENEWGTLYEEAKNISKPILVSDRDTLAKYISASKEQCLVAVDYNTNANLYKLKYCDLDVRTFEGDLNKVKYGFFYNQKRLSSELIEQINMLFAHNSVRNLGNKINGYYFSNMQKTTCADGTAEVTKRPIAIEKLLDGLYVASAGLTIALLFLGIEVFIRKCYDRKWIVNDSKEKETHRRISQLTRRIIDLTRETSLVGSRN